MRPAPGELLHFSEDPDITHFVPRVAATARQPEAYVWTVDHTQAPAYWFPRQCPRAMAWTTPDTPPADAEWLGPNRVHAIEYGWLEAMRTIRLYAYRFAATDFRPFGDNAHVATTPVTPLGPPDTVPDLFALHEEAGIELRVLPTLWPFWHQVTARGLEFSGIRLRNAKP